MMVIEVKDQDNNWPNALFQRLSNDFWFSQSNLINLMIIYKTKFYIELIYIYIYIYISDAVVLLNKK